jgi:hypothetical protein
MSRAHITPTGVTPTDVTATGKRTTSAQTIRRVPIPPRAMPEVLSRLEDDTPGGTTQWRLGAHGACEVEPLRMNDDAGTPPLATAAGRLYGPDGQRAGAVKIEVHAIDARSCEIVLEATDPTADYLRREPATFVALRRAVVRELSEDLLFHAARARARDART